MALSIMFSCSGYKIMCDVALSVIHVGFHVKT
jgi:hypothetical protein